MTSGDAMMADLIPPPEMLFDGSSSPEQFVQLGEGFCREFVVKRARLDASAAFLDIGCGNGGVARPLTQILSAAGRYEGIDVNRDSVAWLQEHYRGHENFRFQHIDVHNTMYQPGGSDAPESFTLPFPDETFDVTLLKSVFTHLMPAGVRTYLKEIGRTLKPGGRAVITYFLLNDESRAFMRRGLDKMSLKHEYEDDPLCLIANPTVPEVTVAHDEHRIRGYGAEAGLHPVEIGYGDWSGRPSLIGLQDVIIAVKGATT